MIKNRRCRYYLGAAYHLLAVYAFVDLWRRTGQVLPLVAAILLLLGSVAAMILIRRELDSPAGR